MATYPTYRQEKCPIKGNFLRHGDVTDPITLLHRDGTVEQVSVALIPFSPTAVEGYICDKASWWRNGNGDLECPRSAGFSFAIDFDWDPANCKMDAVNPYSRLTKRFGGLKNPAAFEGAIASEMRRFTTHPGSKKKKATGCKISQRMRKEGALQEVVWKPKNRWDTERRGELYLNMERSPEVHAFRCNGGHWQMRKGKRAECVYGRQERKASFEWNEASGNLTPHAGYSAANKLQTKKDPDMPDDYWDQAEERMKDLTCPAPTPPPGKEGAVYNPYTKSWHFAGRKKR